MVVEPRARHGPDGPPPSPLGVPDATGGGHERITATLAPRCAPMRQQHRERGGALAHRPVMPHGAEHDRGAEDDLPQRTLAGLAEMRAASASLGWPGRGSHSGRMAPWRVPVARQVVRRPAAAVTTLAWRVSRTTRGSVRSLGERRYRDGDRVRHGRWGDGIVITSRLTRDDEEVSVAFRDPQVGRKTMLASLANLEVIG